MQSAQQTEENIYLQVTFELIEICEYSTLVLPWVAIARFDCHWQHVKSVWCVLIETSNTL